MFSAIVPTTVGAGTNDAATAEAVSDESGGLSIEIIILIVFGSIVTVLVGGAALYALRKRADYSNFYSTYYSNYQRPPNRPAQTESNKSKQDDHVYAEPPDNKGT